MINEAVIGAEGHNTLLVKTCLAGVMLEQGDLGGARELNEAIIRAQEAKLGADHPDTLNTKGNLAYVMSDQGDLQAAHDLFKSVIQGLEVQAGATHQNTMGFKCLFSQTLQKLAIEAETNGERAKAAALYRKAADMREPTLGANIPADVESKGADVAKCRAKAAELS